MTIDVVADPTGTESLVKSAAAHHHYGHVSHHELVGEGEDRAAHAYKHSAFREALSASSDKLVAGALMFAGFAVLLAATVYSAGLALGAAGFAANVLGTAIAGALWLGGNEFIKTYREAKENEHSRLNRAIDKVKDVVEHAKDRIGDKAHRIEDAVAKDVAALGVVAGTVAGQLGTTTFQAQPAAEALSPAATNQTVQRILAEGPRGSAASILESRTQQASTAAQRLEQQADRLLDQAHISV